MLRFLKREEIDVQLWNKCIHESHSFLVYGYSWYMDIASDSWVGIVKDNYEAVMPLPIRKKFFINYIYTPFFVQQLGVFSKNILTCEEINYFLKTIPDKYRFIDLNLNFSNRWEGANGQFVKNRNIELLLNFPHTNLFSFYSKNTQRNIKKSLKNNLVIKFSTRPEEIIELFRKNRGREYGNIKDKDYSRLMNLLNAAKDHISVDIVKVYSGEQLLAGAFFLITEKRVIFLFSGLSEKGKEERAMFFLIDFIIKKYSSLNLIFDFEGSNDEQLARFYMGFGGYEIHYPKFLQNTLPWFLGWLKK